MVDPKADEILSVIVTFHCRSRYIYYLLLEPVSHLAAFSAGMPLEMAGIT